MARKNVRTKGFTPNENPEFAAAMREIGRSSATQRHTLKKYKGSRAEGRRKAVREFA